MVGMRSVFTARVCCRARRARRQEALQLRGEDHPAGGRQMRVALQPDARSPRASAAANAGAQLETRHVTRGPEPALPRALALDMISSTTTRRAPSSRPPPAGDPRAPRRALHVGGVGIGLGAVADAPPPALAAGASGAASLPIVRAERRATVHTYPTHAKRREWSCSHLGRGGTTPRGAGRYRSAAPRRRVETAGRAGRRCRRGLFWRH